MSPSPAARHWCSSTPISGQSPSRGYDGPARRPIERRSPLHIVAGQLALVLPLVMVLSGCEVTAWPGKPTPTPPCTFAGTCDFVEPACGPAITLEQDQIQYGLWYKGVPVPYNTAQLVGFQPVLPTWIPDLVTWYKVILAGPDVQSPNPAPLLYAGYGLWPPTSGHVGGTIYLDSVIAFDETMGAFDPLTNIDGGSIPLRIVAQYHTTVLGQPATQVHLAFATVPGNGYQVTELLWHRGPLTLRVFGVLAGALSVDGFDRVGPPTLGLRYSQQPTDYDAALLNIVASSIPYTACGQ